MLLWDLARDVVLWSETPLQEVAEVFAPAAERMRMAALLSVQADPPVASAFANIARMVGDPRVSGFGNRSEAAYNVSFSLPGPYPAHVPPM